MANIEEKDRILESAQGKIFDRGFSKVTVDEIAEDLGMSKKTIYKFFPSKEDIMLGILRMTMRRIEKQVVGIVDSDKPFEEKFPAFLALLARMARNISKPLQKDIQKYMPAVDREIEEFRREKIYGRLNQMFRQAKAEGFLREDLNVDIFMMVFTSAAQSIMIPSVLADHSFSAQEAFKQIFRILFEGGLTDSARSKFQFFEFSI